jgi:hypothetical protein
MLGSSGVQLNGHAARQFIPGELGRSVPVILMYHAFKSIQEWLSYAVEKWFYLLPPHFGEAPRRRFSIKRQTEKNFF